MCGIVGLFNRSGTSEEVADRLRVMCGAIVHRGPDDEGVFVQPRVGLAMRRLSIIDVQGGHQPICNEDGTVTVVFNGEIYNYRSLREELQRSGHRFTTSTDTEVIVHAYEEYGVDCVKRFNGIFAFALWDARAERLLIARDRIGTKPLYFMRGRNGLAFASEIKALLTLPDVTRRLNLEAAAEFFRVGFSPAPHTLFQGIEKLPAGWLLIAEREQVRTERYWDLVFEGDAETRTFAESCDRLREVLRESVVDQMVSDVPLGAFLSGGVDSTAVVAFMQQASTQKVRTYSIGFDAQYTYHNEAPFAEAAAKALGTEHQTLIVHPQVADLMPWLVEKLDEPLTDTSFILTYLVSELARRDVKVALSGVGGDELFGGYRRYFAPLMNRSVSWIPSAWRRVAGRVTERWLHADRGTVRGNLARYGKAWTRTLHLPLGEQYLGLLSVLSAKMVESLLKSYKASGDPGAELVRYFNDAPARSSLDRLAYVDAKGPLPESLLLFTDKMGMATSLEVRVPFLDNRVVDFVRHCPSHYRMRGFTLKRLLKSALKGVVPDFVLTRSKRGFGGPMGAWLKTDLRPLVSQLLDPGRLKQGGLLNPDCVRRILVAHDAGTEDYTEAIMALLVFEIWREQFKVVVE
jgi:asparagine synthase (glutamine-hydrolysing)